MDSDYFIKEMDRDTAVEILNWRYDDEYRMYNENSDEEDINEMMDGSCLAVMLRKGGIAGFYCYGPGARAVDIEHTGIYDDESYTDFGLGMRPDLCGIGMGGEFMKYGLATGNKLKDIIKFRLSVDSANHRAIKLYERCGFVRNGSFKGSYNGTEAIFIIMLYVFPVDFNIPAGI
jgi:ribosomal-protein-alanine N-acetyltransferase